MNIQIQDGKPIATYTYKIMENKIRQKNKNGETKIFTSYKVSIPKELLEVVSDNLVTYIYERNGHTYMTCCEPDTLTPYMKRKIYPIPNGYTFTLPKKLFNLGSENDCCEYILYLSEFDVFCKDNVLVEIIVK
ncbi:hypothetical protein [Methanosphaera cuniculi]|uniref:Uncharacterized protein n=1 Tax=Methanosphaera cuniculi TaxID=1077256 RepID=A0A2A2HE15_9EURY|nr:hypothetical protein [Methanosphaera cuniculi]PAV07546.1 hypothetical protein ASJ82_07670 [Methanosphaera cuniculi]PWL08137.1 hypothetical protein MSCUN_10680 [Methanosphaera cuniculi]